MSEQWNGAAARISGSPAAAAAVPHLDRFLISLRIRAHAAQAQLAQSGHRALGAGRERGQCSSR